MNPALKALNEEYAKLMEEQEGLFSKGSGCTPDELKRINELDGMLDSKEADIKTFRSVEQSQAKLSSRKEFMGAPATKESPIALSNETERTKVFVMPKGHSKVTAFKGPDAAEKAYKFGKWFLGSVCGHKESYDFCKEYGIEIKAHVEGINSSGGFLVPPEFENEMIDLREQYGLARQFCKVRTMRSDTRTVPRRTGGLTAYAVSEASDITESTKGWDMVELTAKKFGVLSKFSSELNEDAVIDIGNDLAQEISYAFAKKEDDCLWNGDGSSTYHKIVGLRQKFSDVDGTIANIAGMVVGTGPAADYGNLTLTDFVKMKAVLPQYADTPNCAWYCHKTFYHLAMERIMLQAGGITAAELAQGRRELLFMGYPVRISQMLPSVPATSQVVCFFGDLSLSTFFGDRRLTTIALSEHLDFAKDLINIRGTERFDINVHDVGGSLVDADTTKRVPGPLVALITAAS